jgi:hypothetical protein
MAEFLLTHVTDVFLEEDTFAQEEKAIIYVVQANNSHLPNN